MAFGSAASPFSGELPRDAAGVLQVVPIYLGDQAALLPQLEQQLAAVFGLRVERHPPGFDPEIAFEPARGQYNSRILLAQLLRDLRPRCTRILGVTNSDLFIPVLTFVFGEAQLSGRAAVVSTHRLAPELYGLKANPRLFAERLVKEAVHELGHTYGLVHCNRARCVMTSSTYVENIDLKSAQLCDRCRAELRADAARGMVATPG
jgi:archaemetzincin